MKKFLPLISLLLLTIQPGAFAQSGRVFQDYNGNGVQDAGEPGVAGISIKSYKANRTMKCAAVSDSLGNYSFSTPASAGEKLRIEFSIPASMPYFKPAFGGNSYGSAVQFANGPVANKNFAVTTPSRYMASGSDPILIHNRYAFGNQVTGQFRDSCVIFGMRNSWGTSNNSSGSYSHWNTHSPYRIASAKEVGSVYGLVYSKKRKKIYTSAFFRQFSGFGPGGPGAIYQIPYNTTTGSRTAAPSTFVDVATFPGQNMVADPHGTDIPVNWAYTPASTDARMALVSKYSLGDMEISEDESKLYVMNLSNREVIAINPDNGNLISRWNVPTTGLTNSLGNVSPNDIRPFGLGYKNGRLYVGAVATGQSTQTSNGTAAGAAGNDNALHAYVWVLNETTNTFTLVFDFKIKTATPGCYTWQDSWANGVRRINPSSDVVLQPQPILSDIDFYGDDIIVGFRNRSNDQWPVYVHDPVIGYSAYTQKWGDILGGRYIHATGKFVVENNGAIGSRTATGTPGISSGYNEFYRGDGATGSGWDYGFENAAGSFVQVGSNSLVSLQNFPSMSFNVWADGDHGGITWMNNNTGTPTKAYSSFLGDMFNCVAGKSNGLGCIEAVSEATPIEVGNRVWNDVNGNGLQDADEDSYAGVTLQFYDATGTSLLGTTVTDGSGGYLFSNNNVAGGIQPNTTYKIRIISSQFTGSGGIGLLSGMVLTPTAVACDGLPGASDNDAVDNAGFAEITFTTGDYGENNHDLDFGLKSASFLSVASITEFKAERVRETAQLQWVTSFEKDLAYFEVECSVNGTNWQPLGRIQAQGNSSAQRNYGFADVQPQKAVVNLYRLRQVGTDAQVHYSEIRSVRFNDNAGSVSIYPNPAANRVTINIPKQWEGNNVTLTVVGAAGQTVKQIRMAHAAGQEVFDVQAIPAGAYRVTIASGTEKITVPLQVLK